MNAALAGIDLGTDCGWSVLRSDGSRVDSGTWSLRSKGESHAVRVRRLRARLAELLEAHPVKLVAYELVVRHRGSDAAHLYGALQAALVEVCEDKQVDYIGVAVGAVKKGATGKGNADKDAMHAAASQRWGKVNDHNEADALWVAEVARLEVRP